MYVLVSKDEINNIFLQTKIIDAYILARYGY